MIDSSAFANLVSALPAEMQNDPSKLADLFQKMADQYKNNPPA